MLSDIPSRHSEEADQKSQANSSSGLLFAHDSKKGFPPPLDRPPRVVSWLFGLKQIPALILLLGVLLAVLTTQVISALQSTSVMSKLQSVCSERAISISNYMDAVANSLDVQRTMADVYPNSSVLEPNFQDTYAQFVNRSRLESNFFPFQLVAYIANVQNRFHFEHFSPKVSLKQVSSGNGLYGTDATFVDLSSGFTDSAGYYAWIYDTNGSLFGDRVGWDVLTDPILRDEVLSAVALAGKVNSSGLAFLSQAEPFPLISGQYVTRAYMAVINQSLLFPGAQLGYDSNQTAILGLYTIHVLVSDIVSLALADRLDVPVMVEIVDLQRNDSAAISRFVDVNSTTFVLVPQYQTLDFSNSSATTGSWQLRCVATGAFVDAHSIPWYLIALIGLAVCAFFVLLALFLQSLFSKLETIEVEVHERTAELKQAWSDVTLMRQQAEMAADQKSKFMAVLCHELRNPLHAIMAAAGFLEETNLDGEQRHNMLALMETTHLMNSIVNDVLDLAKVESGKLQLEAIPVRVRRLLPTVVAGYEDRAHSKGVDFRLHIDESVPAVVVTDPTRLSQILYNLISNAVKYTDRGYVAVSLRSEPATEEDLQEVAEGTIPAPVSKLIIRVEDTGCGIREAEQSTLFDPYAREKLSITRAGTGTGLGLAISKQLALRMHGDISLESTEEVGTTFTCWVLVGHGDETLFNEEKVDQELEAKTPMDITAVLAGRRVLYADDQSINRKLMERILLSAGIRPVMVSNGLEAVRIVRQTVARSRSRSRTRQLTNPEQVGAAPAADIGVVDLVLLDLNMPVMGGAEAAKLIRELDRNMPIIAVTGADVDEEEKEPCFTEYAFKPITREELLTQLWRILKPRTTSREVGRRMS